MNVMMITFFNIGRKVRKIGRWKVRKVGRWKGGEVEGWRGC